MHRRQKGGVSTEILDKLKEAYGTNGDLNVFYDRFLRKRVYEADSALDGVLIESNEYKTLPPKSQTVSNSILVIDMQNDFMLSPCGAPDVPTYPGCGMFNVANGESIVDPLNAWLKSNMEKVNKIIFSRDSHALYHCSYASQGGIFPDHCQMNSPGAEIHKGFQDTDYINSDKVAVIFKGMSPNVDSFGAFKYAAGDAHAAKRQVGKCCKDIGGPGSEGCSNLTGGFYMKGASNEHAFSCAPFRDTWRWDGKITDDKYTPFKVDDLLGSQTSGEHNIYIVGLAGDWCVRDTAYNIGLMDAVNGVKINVFVVQEFARYAFVPVWAVPTTDLAKLQATTPEKSLVDYAFKFDPFPKWRPLLTDELSSISDADLKPGGGIFHFITDPKDILENYKKANVKLCILPGLKDDGYLGASAKSMAEFAAGQNWSGGARNRKTRNRKNKARKSRKNRRC